MIIGLAGYAQSGKSTVAAILAEERGCKRTAFAQTLKDMLRAFGCTNEQLYGADKEKIIPGLGVTARFLAQTLGTEWGRKTVHRDVWVDRWRASIANLPPSQGVVVEDVRFPSEVAAIRALGGVVIRVDSPRATPPRPRFGGLGSLLARLGFRFVFHASERPELLEVDATIDNSGPASDLRWRVPLALNQARIAAERAGRR